MKRKNLLEDTPARFVIRFVLLCGVFYAAINGMPDSFFQALNVHNALMAGRLLRLLGAEPSVQGALISADGFHVRVIGECSAVFVCLLFLSFVLAYPASVKHKTIGLLCGIPALNAINLLRIALVFLVGMKWPAMFKYAHVYLGQILIIVCVLSGCMVWLRSAGRAGPGDGAFAFFVRFTAISGILFLPWLYLNRVYVLMNDYAVRFLLSLVDCPLILPQRQALHDETFNVVVFSALVLATASIGTKKKIKGLLAGLFLLRGSYILFRLSVALFTAFHLEAACVSAIAAHILGQYVLPTGLWLAIAGRDMLKNPSA
jgi:exosortase H (IPTLxxWG-CTERM-specific)